jgi:transcriptional repressor NrdR
MFCPRCKNTDTKVYDSRINPDGNSIKRRRECLKCSYRFTTVEEIKTIDLKVIKRNGQVVDFDIQKLEYGIRKSFNKRQVDKKLIDELIQDVINDIANTENTSIKSTKIGKIVLKHLREADEAAYICFWAMFGNFQTADEFNKLLLQFKKNNI